MKTESYSFVTNVLKMSCYRDKIRLERKCKGIGDE